jgi:hypothetical protein
MSDNKRVDVLTTASDKSGLSGVFEKFLRTFRNLSFLVVLLPVILLMLGSLSVCLVPSILLFNYLNELAHNSSTFLQAFAIAVGFALGYFIYGMCLIFFIPFINFILQLNKFIKPFRGPWFSLQTIPWYIHNALTYIVRFTFLDFITPTPLNILFYKMMGMKIGKGVVINTVYISDPCLITLEDYVTIGGSATLFGHYGQKGYLVLSPVHIKKNAVIGLKASIMGGVTVGEDAQVLAHSVLFPKTVVPDGEIVPPCSCKK